MPSLPALDIKTGINDSPHVVLLGAGASRACCPNGDATGKALPLMADFVDKVGLRSILKKSNVDIGENFESIYSHIHKAGDAKTLQALDEKVREYFLALRLPDTPTLYDYLVLSLRPKDAIVTFNWDPLLPQAYKRWRHLGHVLPEIFFLHGNVDIGIDLERRASRFLSDAPINGFSITPTRLLYPVENKSYNDDPFIADQWQAAAHFMSIAYYATIYGYSAPQSDVEAKSLLLNAWKENPTRELAEFSIVDLRDPVEVETAWSDFIVRTHGGATQDFKSNILRRHPRRSCEAFAFATLQQAPWKEDPFPEAKTLEELEKWVAPLLEEEKSGKLNGKPLH